MKIRMRSAALVLTVILSLLLCGCALHNAPAAIKIKDKAEVTPTPAPTEEIKIRYMSEAPRFRLGNEDGNITTGGYTVMRQVRSKGEDGKWHYDCIVYAALEDGIYRGRGYEQGTFEDGIATLASCCSRKLSVVFSSCGRESRELFDLVGERLSSLSSFDSDLTFYG